jgi:hypothetical protein
LESNVQEHRWNTPIATARKRAAALKNADGQTRRAEERRRAQAQQQQLERKRQEHDRQAEPGSPGGAHSTNRAPQGVPNSNPNPTRPMSPPSQGEHRPPQQEQISKSHNPFKTVLSNGVRTLLPGASPLAPLRNAPSLTPESVVNGLNIPLKWAQQHYQGAERQLKSAEQQVRRNPIGGFVAGIVDGQNQVRSTIQHGAKQIDPFIRNGVDQVYDFARTQDDRIRQKVEGIPVVEQATGLLLQNMDVQRQITGGTLKFGGSLLGGAATVVTDPVSTLKGMYSMAEHIPPEALFGPLPSFLANQANIPLFNPLKAMHGAYDVVVNGEDPKARMQRVIDPERSRQEDFQFGKQMLGGITEPFMQSWRKGNYVDAITQGGLEVASTIFGPGAAKAGVTTASTAARTSNIVNKLDTVSDLSKADTLTDAAKMTRATETTKATTAIDELTEAERQSRRIAQVDESKTIRTPASQLDPKLQEMAEIRNRLIRGEITEPEAIRQLHEVRQNSKGKMPSVTQNPKDQAGNAPDNLLDDSSRKERGYQSTPEIRQSFKEFFGEVRYKEYAEEIERLKLKQPELKNIPTEDLVAVRGYTSSDYAEINRALRSGDPAELKRLDAYIKAAESGLNQLPSYRGEVFRGTDLPPEVASKYKAGEVVTEDAFTSTSAEFGREFSGNTQFIIESQNGKRIDYLSEFPSETEVLFAPNSQFKVLEVEVDPSTGRRQIMMNEVPTRKAE